MEDVGAAEDKKNLSLIGTFGKLVSVSTVARGGGGVG